MSFNDVYLVTSELKVFGEDDCADLERELGFSLPAGYAEFLSRFGEGTYSGFVRIYPPQKIRDEYRDFQQRWDEYYFWDAGADVLTKSEVIESVIVGDTLQGDELIVHPRRPDTLYVLPRDHESIFEVGADLETALAWLCESGTLTAPIPLRYFESWAPRERASYTAAIEFEAAAQALANLGLHDLIQIDEEDGFAELFVREFNGSVVVGFNGTGLTASIASEAGVESPKLEAVRQCLETFGFAPDAS